MNQFTFGIKKSELEQAKSNPTLLENLKLLESMDPLFSKENPSIELSAESFCYPNTFVKESNSGLSQISYYDEEQNKYIKLLETDQGHFFSPFRPINLFSEKVKEIQLNKALFLDRDGIVIRDTHYPHLPEDLEILKPAIDLINLAKSKNFQVILISNQAGVAKKKFTLEQMQSFHQLLEKELREKYQIKFDDVYYCPHLNHFDRKPSPGMLLKAVQRNKIDLKRSIMIGDKASDNFLIDQMKFFLLKSQYCQEHPSLIQDLDEVYQYLI